jgi:transcriptional regulator GlxA family with amidase domain
MEWERVSPVLHATYRLLGERPGDNPSQEDVAALLPGMSSLDVSRALLLLRDMGYVGGYKASGPRLDLISATEKGLQETMAWPVPGDARVAGFEALLSLLDERIQQAQTTDERTRLQRLRDSAADLGTGVAGEVLGAWVARVTGLAP